MAGTNINKKHFWVTGSSVGVLSVIYRSSVGVFREGIREVKETAILTKVLLGGKVPEYNSGAIDIERREIKEPPQWMALLVL